TEWAEKSEEVEPHHRHFSHLWGLHPGRHITAATPALFAAVRRSHELRGDEGTGSSDTAVSAFWRGCPPACTPARRSIGGEAASTPPSSPPPRRSRSTATSA